MSRLVVKNDSSQAATPMGGGIPRERKNRAANLFLLLLGRFLRLQCRPRNYIRSAAPSALSATAKPDAGAYFLP